MSNKRFLFRLALLGVAISALSFAAAALYKLGGQDPQAWATVTASLAVLAALGSVLLAQRIVEMQEDALEPNPEPFLDVRTRYDIVQFRIVNRGGTVAHNVSVKWNVPLKNVGGNTVSLGGEGTIRTLHVGDSASTWVGEGSAFFKKYPDATYSGEISYQSASGKKFSKMFTISAEHHREALVHDAEELRTHVDLQKIPGALEKIALELHAIRSGFNDELEQERKK